MIGLIFAGGKSSRFGCDKATFRCANLPLSNIQLATKKLLLFCDEIIICANEDNKVPIKRLITNYPRTNIVTDIALFDHHGPLSAIVAGTKLHSSTTQEYITLAVDYPYIKTNTIKRLVQVPNSFLATENHDHYSLAHFSTSYHSIINWLKNDNWRLRDFILKRCRCQPIYCEESPELQNLNYQRGINMKNKDSMTAPDFQKLIALVLNDLALRRTMLENREQDVSQQMSSLERDAELEQLDDQIQQIKNDFNHYKEFQDPKFDFNAQEYFQGPSMGLPRHP
ncbi:molybdenum cofactor guanylyltransferase [Limosilactobacillus sp. STM2_1]|uniref:Molybdenum cofactor guanylyltransferase n=1 Tax=Limosilactobacillus rudii TaxID=2759755 RepID=A0A7W3YN78_9LACO|nr:molybdenum cofactor guanylyltransferase [Limosilactobacillus rudii]MBB1078890.1 molybdenum cofactor guanylyltransferase [Limosilactobacillus rudii]MBB1098234.1 molybdenum cofactor guanylyltransferase [Limosilactobacillus rudii]MCD7135651.1 molybdenum cofactor guanylyltransferase [Limosilactobacillus rudii]